MGIAKYFSKDALAMSQILQGGSVEQFETILDQHIVEIAFDKNAVQGEGLISLDLLIRLISRLYPKIKITALSDEVNEVAEEFSKLAKRINSRIEIVDDLSTISLVLGRTSLNSTEDKPIFYLGSDEWFSKLSRKDPVGSGQSQLPFASGFSVCLGVANLFRFIFRELIEDSKLDEEVFFSLLELQASDQTVDVECSVNDIGDVKLVGAGAVGNGILWAFSKLNDCRGVISIIDPEKISLSNLQRYILTNEDDLDGVKVEVAKAAFKNSTIQIDCFCDSWQSYIKKQQLWDNQVVLTALDSAKDRMLVQSSLPRYIFNGFTELGLLGVSKHLDFGQKACLDCMYIATNKKKSLSETVAENLGVPQFERSHIRETLYLNSGMSQEILNLVAQANQISIDQLNQFLGVPISEFYSNFVCGGILLALKNGYEPKATMEAPLAFQSAMAGILVASEFYLWKSGHRHENFPNITHVYPLLPIQNISNPYTHQLNIDSTGRCICSDEDYRAIYAKKWNASSKENILLEDKAQSQALPASIH